MLSSTNPINAPRCEHQSSTIRTQKMSNGKPVKEVVIHHPLMSPPLEDWVLFPGKVIHTKHSTIRDSRVRQAKELLQPAEQSRSSSAHTTTTSRATSTSSRNTSISSFIEEPRDQSDSSSALVRRGKITKPTGNVVGGSPDSPTNPPRVNVPQRLPTPDLSDVEEDDFWSCCGSSKRGRCDQMDCAIDVPNGFCR